MLQPLVSKTTDLKLVIAATKQVSLDAGIKVKTSHMRLFIISLLVVLASTSIRAQSYGERAARETALDFLEKFSPTSHQAMQMLADLPTQFTIKNSLITNSEKTPFTVWINERTEKGIIESLNTVVHESLHGFTSRYAYKMLEDNPPADYQFGDSYSAFYMSKNEIHLVKHTEVFTSNLLKKRIPKELRTFRYDPYIVPKDDHLGSQIQGIYGLMDEWNAYYHGTKTAYDLFGYYRSKALDKDQKVYLGHVSNLAGTYFAYYEFKYYILKYLELAKSTYPQVYADIMANEPLRKVYTAIDEQFNALLSLFETRLDTIENLVASDNRTSVYRQDGYYFIGSSGVGLFSEEAGKLKAELSKPSMVRIDRSFRLR